ncbi:MAG: mechanosensitive ion channel [Flavobacteriaceae bacterium]|nr:mechanosensitive ion channel [Flavobacteriaceae bacterium]
MDSIKHVLYDYLITLGLDDKPARYINLFALLIASLIAVLIIDYLVRNILRAIFAVIAKSSRTKFDNFLIKNKMPRNLAHIVPVLITLEFAPIIFSDFPYVENIVEKGLQIFAIILTLWIMRSLLKSLEDYLKTLDNFKDKPIDSYIQVVMIFAWMFGILSIMAILTGISFFKFITTIGTASAIIILIFRDTILGFVASIQVSINDMVRIGDWITFEKYGADGEVIEINLATVMVRNWDLTITTIPTYALISDSFKNWRGMQESGGRRIKRAVHIKINSVAHLSPEQIEKLKKIHLISDYVSSRQKDIDAYNEKHDINKELLMNGRNLTNLGVFRKYIETYVEKHSAINKDMMIMTRQLAPTPTGIPLEIYAFSSDKRWENYEYIMSDIFDHVISSVQHFDLEFFEYPTDSTFKKFK